MKQRQLKIFICLPFQSLKIDPLSMAEHLWHPEKIQTNSSYLSVTMKPPPLPSCYFFFLQPAALVWKTITKHCCCISPIQIVNQFNIQVSHSVNALDLLGVSAALRIQYPQSFVSLQGKDVAPSRIEANEPTTSLRYALQQIFSLPQVAGKQRFGITQLFVSPSDKKPTCESPNKCEPC